MEKIHEKEFKECLEKTIRGYHKINTEPIKESVWEGILAKSMGKAGIAHKWIPGSHKPGADIYVDSIGISCKSTKQEQKTILKISSYRMTTIFTIDEFIREIDEVRGANFQYYGVLSRVESKDKKNLVYSVYMIPASKIKAFGLEWKDKKTKKGKMIWDTKMKDGMRMYISEAMSNQLWISLNKQRFAEYLIIENLQISVEDTELDYADLFDLLSLSDRPSSPSPSDNAATAAAAPSAPEALVPA